MGSERACFGRSDDLITTAKVFEKKEYRIMFNQSFLSYGNLRAGGRDRVLFAFFFPSWPFLGGFQGGSFIT
jgi:hypothetical protein